MGISLYIIQAHSPFFFSIDFLIVNIQKLVVCAKSTTSVYMVEYLHTDFPIFCHNSLSPSFLSSFPSFSFFSFLPVTFPLLSSFSSFPSLSCFSPPLAFAPLLCLPLLSHNLLASCISFPPLIPSYFFSIPFPSLSILFPLFSFPPPFPCFPLLLGNRAQCLLHTNQSPHQESHLNPLLFPLMKRLFFIKKVKF